LKAFLRCKRDSALHWCSMLCHTLVSNGVPYTGV